ncbi:MAG: permease-like cell division protein FtsX [Pseudomonadota bacterium]|jgi:cell division transport system permease protein|nr:MAG: cell division protein [Pseudomonadota bacterium]
MTRWLTRHVQSALFATGRLVRSPLSTAFTVLVIAIALTLPAALGLAIVSVREATGDFSSAVDVSVFFRRDVPVEKARQLADSLRQRSGVASVTLITADEALAAFREKSGFGEALDALGRNPLPHALEVRPEAGATSPAQMEALREYIAAWPEVELVQVDSVWVQRLNAILDLLRGLVKGAAVLLGLGVLAVIGNTVRLEIYNRRDEIEVTKLVGGSNAFVRRPFLYTGLLYGLMGGMVAALLVELGLALLNAPVSRLAATYGSDFRLLTPTVREVGILLGAGALLGLLGAGLATGRHLARIEPRA